MGKNKVKKIILTSLFAATIGSVSGILITNYKDYLRIQELIENSDSDLKTALNELEKEEQLEKNKFKLQMESSLYHKTQIDLKSKDDCEKEEIANEFVEDMQSYEIFNQENYDIDYINECIKDIIANNPYTDLSRLSDHITVTDVKKLTNEETSYASGTTTYTFPEIVSNYGITITLFNNSSDNKVSNSTYLHELIHSFYPQIDHMFFEEAITDVVTKEYFSESDSVYSGFSALLKMMIEITGVDIFKEIRATGSTELLKVELSKIGVSNEDIEFLFDDLQSLITYNRISIYRENDYYKNKFPELYDEKGNLDLKTFDEKENILYNEIMDKIYDIYYIKYNRIANENIIMTAYRDEVNNEFWSNYKKSYELQNVNYFSTKSNNDYEIYPIIYSDFTEKVRGYYRDNVPIHLTDDDYNIKPENKESKGCR